MDLGICNLVGLGAVEKLCLSNPAKFLGQLRGGEGGWKFAEDVFNFFG